MRFPSVSPWAEAALWHGLTSCPRPATSIALEVNTLIGHRLAPLVLDSIKDTGAVVDRQVVSALRSADFRWNSLSTEVVQSSYAATRAFEEQGLDYVIFKGPAIRHCYRSPRHRPFSDVDLLVRPGDFARARLSLTERGWREDSATQLPYDSMNRTCREAQNLKRDRGESVDLHHRLPPWPWTTHVTYDEIYRASVVVDGRRMMSPEWNLLVASLHIVSDKSKPGQTLIIWRDLAELARVVDHAAMADLAGRVGLGPWVREVLTALPEHVRPMALCAALPAGQIAHRRRLELLSNPRLVGQRLPIVQLFRLPASRALLYALGTIFPPPGFIRRKYGSIRRGYRRWWFGDSNVQMT